jgi:hypothetical protein
MTSSFKCSITIKYSIDHLMHVRIKLTMKQNTNNMTKTKATKYLVRLKCDPFVEPHSIQTVNQLTKK